MKTPNDSLRFLKLTPYAEILSKINSHFASYTPRAESIRLDLALGTISAEEVTSRVEIPERTITAMDGYAVRSSDLKSASVAKPRLLSVRGSIFPDQGANLPSISADGAYYVATGAPLPRGSDAVVRVELAVQEGNNRIIVKRPIERGKDVAKQGEDIRKGQVLVKKGKILNPTDMALLIGVGRTHIRVFRIPNVGLLSVGNELKEFNPSARAKSSDGHIINNYQNLLFGYLQQLGANPVTLGVCSDNQGKIQRTIIRNMKKCDMLLTISGSSVGRRDNVLDAMRSIDGSEVLFHGLRVVPIKPSGVVMVKGKPVVIIPGHAVSSLLTFFTVALPILNALSGLKMHARKVMISVEAKGDIVNERPIDALCLVRLESDASGKYGAVPLDWGSNLVSNLSRADGFVWLSKSQIIPMKEMVRVQLFTGSPIAKSA